jgi:hypothetical protein
MIRPADDKPLKGGLGGGAKPTRSLHTPGGET